MLLADVNSTAYEIVLSLHIIAVVIGFGGVALAGITARVALQHQGAAGGAVAEAGAKLVALAEYAIYLVPILGIGLVSMSGHAFGFGDPWISASFTLYVIALAIALAVIRPAMKRFAVAVADEGQAVEAEKLHKTLSIAGGVVNLIWVVVVFLMVLKPGA